MYNNNRDFGGSGVFGNNANESQSQWVDQNQNSNNNNMFNNNFSQVRGMTAVYDRALVPTTIKQILLSPNPEPEEPFKMDGKPIHTISIIATVDHISPQSAFTTFVLDDYGAQIACKLWTSDDSDLKELEDDKLKKGQLVRVIGKVDCFQKKKAINIHHMEPIDDFNEVYLHGLECIFAHEMNQLAMNQHIPQYKNRWNRYMGDTREEHNKVQSEIDNWRAQKDKNKNSNNYSPNRFVSRNQNNFNDNHSNSNALIDESGLSELEKDLLHFMRNQYLSGGPNRDVGYTVQAIGAGINVSEAHSIKKALIVLDRRGLVYESVDNHYAYSPPDNQNN
eukprot:102581_1